MENQLATQMVALYLSRTTSRFARESLRYVRAIMVMGCSFVVASGSLDAATCVNPDFNQTCDANDSCWAPTAGVPNVTPWLVNNKSESPLIENRAFCSDANAGTPTDGIGRWYSYSVYLPPAYEDYEATIEFPVVYSLHGSNGWNGASYFDNVSERIHSRIIARQAKPAVYVFPYGGCDVNLGSPPGYCVNPNPPVTWQQWCDRVDPNNGDFRVDSALRELFDHIAENYAVTQQPEGIGIEGFSSGGGKALALPLPIVHGHNCISGQQEPVEVGSVVALSPALDSPWSDDVACTQDELDNPGNLDHEACDDIGDVGYGPSVQELLDDLFPVSPSDDSFRLMVKYGAKDDGVDEEDRVECLDDDFGSDGDERDQTAILAEQVSLSLGSLWTYDNELVVPACGDDIGHRDTPGAPGANEVFCTMSPPDPEGACRLGHQSSRMLDNRGDEIVGFHQKSYWGLAGIEAYHPSGPSGCPVQSGVLLDAVVPDRYLVGDWDGDGCDTVAISTGDELHFDPILDSEVESPIPLDFSIPASQTVSVRFGNNGRDSIVFEPQSNNNCGQNELELKLLDPIVAGSLAAQLSRDVTLDDLPETCLNTMHPLDAGVFAGDFGAVDGIIPTTGDSVGDWREDLGIRVAGDNTVEWHPQVAWGFRTEPGDTLNYGGVSDHFTAGYWSSSDEVFSDAFATIPGVQIRLKNTPDWDATSRAMIIPGGVEGILTVQGPVELEPFTARGGILYDPELDNQISIIEADIDPHTSTWTAVGFSSSPNGIGKFQDFGEIWVQLTEGPDSDTVEVNVLADGLNLLATGMHSALGLNRRVKLRYDPSGLTAAVWINDTELFTDAQLNLATLLPGFSPDGVYAGFQIHQSDKHGARIDNFLVRQERFPHAGLGVRRKDGLPENIHRRFLLNYNFDGGHNLSYDYGDGLKTDDMNPGSDDEYLFGDWDGDGRTDVGVRGCAVVELDGENLSPSGDLGGNSEASFSIGNPPCD